MENYFQPFLKQIVYISSFYYLYKKNNSMIRVFVLCLVLASCSNGKEVTTQEHSDTLRNGQEASNTTEQKKAGNELKINPEEIKKIKVQSVGTEQTQPSKGKNKKQNSK